LLVLGELTFKNISNFKYLGVDINLQANSHEEINRKTAAEINAILRLYRYLSQGYYPKI